MNSITIILVLVVLIIAVGIGLALFFSVRSLLRPNNNQDSGAMSSQEREEHIDHLLNEFEKQMGRGANQDQGKNNSTD